MEPQAVPIDAQDVEPRPRMGRVKLQIIGRNFAQAAAFARVDGAQRRAVVAAAAGLDLDENNRRTVGSDDVDFAARAAQIARHDAIAERAQVCGRGILGVASEACGPYGAPDSNAGVIGSNNESIFCTRMNPRR